MSCEDQTNLSEAKNGKTKDSNSPNNWESATFAGNEDRKEKFLRLMGAKKDGPGGDKEKSSGPVQSKIDRELEQQFEQSQEHKRLSGKHGHMGLGFKPDQGEDETQQESATAPKKARKDGDGGGDNSNSKFPAGDVGDEDDEDEDDDDVEDVDDDVVDEDEEDDDDVVDGCDDDEVVDDLSDEDEDEDLDDEDDEEVEDEISEGDEEGGGGGGGGKVGSEAKKAH